MTTRLFIVDIDGCLVPVGRAPYDLEILAEVAALNRDSREDPSIPELTILSGRPHPYVDALMQLLDIRLPAIFENGAGLAVRKPYGARYRPEVEAGRAHLDLLRIEIERGGVFSLQPGKTASLTVLPAREADGIGSVIEELERLSRDHRLDLIIDPSHDCVNVLVPGVDKGMGLRWLTEETGATLPEVAGIGDSSGDLAWLRLCGTSAAPANAEECVRSEAHWVSEQQDVAAVLEFYCRLVEDNRQANA